MRLPFFLTGSSGWLSMASWTVPGCAGITLGCAQAVLDCARAALRCAEVAQGTGRWLTPVARTTRFSKAAHMSTARPQMDSTLRRILGAVGLAVTAGVVALFTAPFVVQAFRGPRTITEQELLALNEPGSWDNYVRF